MLVLHEGEVGMRSIVKVLACLLHLPFCTDCVVICSKSVFASTQHFRLWHWFCTHTFLVPNTITGTQYTHVVMNQWLTRRKRSGGAIFDDGENSVDPFSTILAFILSILCTVYINTCTVYLYYWYYRHRKHCISLLGIVPNT